MHRVSAMSTAKILMGLVFLVFAFFGCSDNPESPAASEPETQIHSKKSLVAIGDSLTAGLGVDASKAFPAQLEKRLAADGYNIRVINAGISGETSSGTLSRIEWVLTSLNPDYVILVTGANDGLRGIDTDLLQSNLDDIITKLKNRPVKILFGGMKMLPNLGPTYAGKFEGVYKAVAQKHGVLFVPFFLEGVAGEPHYNQADGIHPTAEGYTRIVDHIYPYVKRLIRQTP